MTLSLHTVMSWAFIGLLTLGLARCPGGGESQKDHLRKEYDRDPDAYKKKWGGNQ